MVGGPSPTLISLYMYMLIPTSRAQPSPAQPNPAQPNPTRPAPPHQTTPHRGANTTKPHPTARASERKSTHSDHPPDQFSSSGSLPLLGFQSGLLLQSRFPLLAGIEAQRFLLASKHSDSSCWRRSTASAGVLSSASEPDVRCFSLFPFRGIQSREVRCLGLLFLDLPSLGIPVGRAAPAA